MLKFEKRENIPLHLRILIPLISILLGVLIGGIAVMFSQVNPLTVYKAIFIGAF